MKTFLIVLAVLLVLTRPGFAQAVLTAELGACTVLAWLITRTARRRPWIAEYPYRGRS